MFVSHGDEDGGSWTYTSDQGKTVKVRTIRPPRILTVGVVESGNEKMVSVRTMAGAVWFERAFPDTKVLTFALLQGLVHNHLKSTGRITMMESCLVVKEGHTNAPRGGQHVFSVRRVKKQHLKD